MPKIASGFYKIRYHPGHNDVRYATLAVPRAISEAVPKGTIFTPEFTDEGILYRVVAGPGEVELPDWVTDGGAETSAPETA
jgi:hypothetical protein